MNNTGTIIVLLTLVILWILWVIHIYLENRNSQRKK